MSARERSSGAVRRVRWIAYAAVAVLAAVAIALAALHLPAVQSWVFHQAQPALRSSFDLDLRVSRFSFNLFLLSARLEDFSAAAASRPDLPPFAAAREVTANLSWGGLLWGIPTVEEAEIDALAVTLLFDEDGNSNLPQPPPAPGEPSPGPLRLDQFLIRGLRVNGASFLFEDRPSALTVNHPEWRLEVSGDALPWRQRIELSSAAPGTFTYQGRALPLEMLRVALLAEPAEIQIEQVEIRLGQSRLQSQGAVVNLDEPDFDLNTQLALALDELAPWFASDQAVEGTLRAEVASRGTVGSLEVEAQLEGESLRYGQLRNASLAGDISWTQARDRLAVRNFDLRSPSGAVQASAELALAGNSPGSLEVRFERVSLPLVSRQFQLPLQIASSLSGQAEARGPGLEFRQWSGQGRFSFAPRQPLPNQDELPLAGSLTVNADPGRLRARTANLSALGVQFIADVSLRDEERLEGTLDAEVSELSETLAQADRLLGAPEGEPTAPVSLSGPLRLAATLGGSVSSPAAEFSVESPSLTAGQVEGIALAANGGYDPGEFRLSQARIEWRQQVAVAQATVGLRGEQPVEASLQVEGARILALRQAFDVTAPVEGALDVSAGVSGTMDHPNARLQARVSGLEAYQETWGELTISAAYFEKRVQLEELKLEKPLSEGGSGELLASGSLDTGTGAYTLSLDSQNLRFESLSLPEAGVLRGAWRLRAEGQGTLDDPALETTVQLENAMLDDFELGRVDLRATVAGEQARVNLAAPRFGVVAEASTGLSVPHPAEAELQIGGLDLARLGITLPGGEALTGALTGRVSASGDLERWQSARVEAHFEELRAQFRGQTLESLAPLRAVLEQRRLHVEPALFAIGELRAALTGSIPLEAAQGEGDLTFGVNGPLAGLLAFAPPVEGLEAEGVIELGAVVQGSLEKFDPAVSFRIREGRFNHPSLPREVAEVFLDSEVRDGEIRLRTLEAGWAGAEIRGEALVPLSLLEEAPAGTATAKLGIEGLDLAALEMLPEPMGGVVGARIELAASDFTLEAVSGSLVLEPLEIRLGEVRMAPPSPAEVVLEAGVLRVRNFRLENGGAAIALSGSAALAGDPSLDLQLSGRADAGLASVFVPDLRVTGATTFEAAVTGSLDDPQIQGRLDLAGGQLYFPSPELRAQDVEIALRLDQGRIELESLRGAVNGGRIEAGGSLVLEGGAPRQVDLEAQIRNLFLNAPEGLQTLSDGGLTIRSQGEFIVVGGELRVQEGSYREQIDPTGFLQGGGDIEFVEDRDPLLARLRYDVRIETEDPIVVDNDLAQLRATTALNLVGTYYRPSVTGRLVLEEGGEIYLAERRYFLEEGVVTFASENRIEPNLNIVARTAAAGYDIDMRLTGPADDVDVTFTSDPYLDEGDILSVLLTGRKLEEAQERGAMIVREQALSLITGQLAGRLSRGARETLGLSQVRIEPNLIAAESDPTARLTIGQDLRRDLHLTYSIDLVNSADQIWIAEYDVSRRFSTRGVRQSDDTYRFDFEHDLRFGGDPEQRRRRSESRDRSRIAAVEFEGEPVFDPKLLQDKSKLKPGKPFDFFRARRGVDRLEKLYRENGYLESNIRLQQQRQDSAVAVTFEINAGPEVEFLYEGYDPDSSLRERVRAAWYRGVFDLQRAEEAASLIRRRLIEQNHYEARVTHEVLRREGGLKRVVFTVEPGPRYADAEWVFEGAGGVAPDTLAQLIEDAPEGRLNAIDAPRRLVDLLQAYYREQGYLEAQVGRPRQEFDAAAGVARVLFPVQEGPRYRFGQVQWEGVSAVEPRELRLAVTVEEGQEYVPEAIRNSVERLEELYWSKGYNDVLVEYAARRDNERQRVGITFLVTENERGVVEEVAIEGTRDVGENFVRKRVMLRPGEPLRFEQTDRSRRLLYNTGAFSLIEIDSSPLASGANPPGVKPVRLVTRVREVTPYKLRYGAFYDTDRGPGFILDAENRNSLLGGARMIGLRTRYDSDLREGRVFFGQPFYFQFPSMATANSFVRREIRDILITDRAGVSMQHEMELRRNMLLNYGYRFERNHTFEREPDPFLPFDETVNIAPLTASFSWDRRDDFLDATQGFFSSHGFEYAPASLGSSIQFVKYFGQYFHYLPLSEPAEIPFSRGLKKPRVVYASGVRVGLAKGLGGQELFPSERFFAGGGTTVRGFRQDALGPADFLGDPTGGDAVFVANNELRFPIRSIFEGVGFLDLGNIYRRIGDFNPFDLRATAGAGLRVRTPYVLLRLDYGVKLDRQAGESRSAIFFSIGQAF